MKLSNKIKHLIGAFRGIPIEYDLTTYETILAKINALSNDFEQKTDVELQTISQQIKSTVRETNDVDSVLIEAYALVREVCWRKLKMRPYNVQIIAGIVLHHGKLAEMKTGEGKTLAAVLPVYLNALSGKGVHVLTFNDYLAQRDANWMRSVYEFLGLTVGSIQEDMDFAQRKIAYECDITYATAKQVGFDYLRSFIAYDAEEIVLRPFHFAIVDEADALLIDEARNPLVLAGNIIEIDLDFYKIAQLVQTLEEGKDFERDNYGRTIYLTEIGNERLETFFKIDNLHDKSNTNLLSAVNLALHARMLLRRDVDYVIREGEVKLIDEFTGRIVEDRKWQNGLQIAVEAKEGLEIQSEGNILGSISLQHFIRHYPKLAGMTATAQPAAEEFAGFYGLKTVVIPPNLKCIRIDYPDEIFTNQTAKRTALLEEIKKIHQTGRPILIGTLTVKESEELYDLLSENGIRSKVLNAKNDALEAAIIAEAGALNAVTISTNMAGRGTDIVLGGNVKSDKKRILELGGLHVIGTNRHESLRVDNQLRGRAGRQGDPGSSRFFISFDDPLMVKYKMKDILPKRFKTLQQTEAITHSVVAKRIKFAQEIIEDQMYEVRRSLFQYTTFVEKQRKLFQTERQGILSENSKLFESELFRTTDKRILKDYLLYQFDKQWAKHLNYASEVREGVHFVRLGGQRPIHVFHEKVSDHFEDMVEGIEQLLESVMNATLNTTDLGIQKPSSTWTYIINDNPFGNKLATMLIGNVGMQVDFLTAPLLFLKGLIDHWKSRKK